jgi:hypothetical protein
MFPDNLFSINQEIDAISVGSDKVNQVCRAMIRSPDLDEIAVTNDGNPKLKDQTIKGCSETEDRKKGLERFKRLPNGDGHFRANLGL